MDHDVQQFLPLHPLAFRVLLVLLDGPTHGYEVAREIQARERAGPTFYPANLYRRMRRLLADGLLEERPAQSADDHPARRYLAVTRLGRAVARAETDRLAALVSEAKAAGLRGRA